jgi:hypothetical protein
VEAVRAVSNWQEDGRIGAKKRRRIDGKVEEE